MRQRINVVAIIHNQNNEILLCKQTQDGVYPGQWAIPGGGVEPGEGLEEALKREIKEELGVEISAIKPFNFSDDIRDKKQKDGTTETFHMIYLLFDCEIAGTEAVQLNEEFDTLAWVKLPELGSYDLNSATVKTFKQKGFL